MRLHGYVYTHQFSSFYMAYNLKDNTYWCPDSIKDGETIYTNICGPQIKMTINNTKEPPDQLYINSTHVVTS